MCYVAILNPLSFLRNYCSSFCDNSNKGFARLDLVGGVVHDSRPPPQSPKDLPLARRLSLMPRLCSSSFLSSSLYKFSLFVRLGVEDDPTNLTLASRSGGHPPFNPKLGKLIDVLSMAVCALSSGPPSLAITSPTPLSNFFSLLCCPSSGLDSA